MQDLKNIHKALDRHRKTFAKKECLHPDAPEGCCGRIVRAHTVQKSLLKKIANNNHVYTPGLEFHADGIQFKMMRKGIKQASTFTGFCSYHDDILFAPIEKRPLVLNEHHALLLTYRCLSKELFNKRRTAEIYAATVINDLEIGSFAREYARVLETGTLLAIDNDWSVFQHIGESLTSESYYGSFYCAFELDAIPDILCGGAANVNFDFNHNKLQFEDQERPLDLITLSLLPFNERGIAVFSWHEESIVNVKLMNSLLSHSFSEIPDAIVRLVFQYFDNFFAAPRWWERLPLNEKEALAARFESTFIPLPYRLPVDDIRADGVNYVDWKVTDIKTNLKL